MGKVTSPPFCHTPRTHAVSHSVAPLLPFAFHPASQPSTSSTHLTILMGRNTRTPILNLPPAPPTSAASNSITLEGSYNAGMCTCVGLFSGWARDGMAAGDGTIGSPQCDIKVQVPASHNPRSENTKIVPRAVSGINLKDMLRKPKKTLKIMSFHVMLIAQWLLERY